ncbi:MAG: transketolase [Bacteroidetes bacterium]|nr:transketolase [Bacteroidota bacterium]
MNIVETKNLQKKLRLKLLEMYFKANAGHIGCSLSCIDILISVFFNFKKKEDVFILSKGHAAVALYCCLNEIGEISDDELNTFYKDGTKLPAHPAPNSFESIPFATGSLGHGFPLAAGIAKAKKIKNEKSFVYVLISDGDTNEGTTWETAHFASKHELNNLIVIIDKNKIQGFDRTDNVLGDTAKKEKWIEMGFEVKEIADGHDISEISNSIDFLKKIKNNKPKMLIANTIKGKGVSYMENTIDWHYWPMNENQYNQAIQEINEKYNA